MCKLQTQDAVHEQNGFLMFPEQSWRCQFFPVYLGGSVMAERYNAHDRLGVPTFKAYFCMKSAEKWMCIEPFSFRMQAAKKESKEREALRRIEKLRANALSRNEHIRVQTRQTLGVMERKASMLALRSKRGEATCKADTRRKTQENSLLIHELEELRIEKKSLQVQVQELELQVKLAEQKVEQKQVQKALPSTGKPQLERSQSHSKGVPQAAQGLFEEAPAIHRGPKGSKLSKPVKSHEASAHHKSQEELRLARQLRKQAEQKEQQRHHQRVREELVPQELDNLMKRKAEEELHKSTGSVGDSHSSVSSGPPVGKALSAVRFHQSKSPMGSVDSMNS
ncbi:unnamed protein product [Symbiodinium natans]|uniref:Uncharacterized protein n=1 Tax=Symbiodinium natans TaxID=878477 RepID=A0A812UBA5_9DINO|nr:unnamed protein product [Symbiodinium natans]